MNNKRTPGFYEIELARISQAYGDMCLALAKARELIDKNPKFTVVDLKRVEDDYFSVMNDYFIANENFVNSDNDVVLRAMALVEVQQQRMTWLGRLRKFVKGR